MAIEFQLRRTKAIIANNIATATMSAGSLY
jgi:hypothetical protein